PAAGGAAMTVALVVLAVLVLLAAAVVVLAIRARHMQIWLGSYLRRRLPPRPASGPVHVMFAFVDHFEPNWPASTSLPSARASIVGAATTARWPTATATPTAARRSTASSTPK